MTISNLLEQAQSMNDVDVTRFGPGLAAAEVEQKLAAAGAPAHPELVSLYGQVNGMSLTRVDIELLILDLDYMTEGNAFEHLFEIGGFMPEDEEREALEVYHVFAKHERAMWLCNLSTLETARAFDYDVERLSLSFSQMLEQIIAHRFAPDWFERYRV